MEKFDANRDCVTGREVPVTEIIKAAQEQRFDGLPYSPYSTAHVAALAVLKDLSWRNGIAGALKGCDMETRGRLVERLTDIIEASYDGTIDMLETRIKDLVRQLEQASGADKSVNETIVDLRTRLGISEMGREDLLAELADAKRRIAVARARLMEAEADKAEDIRLPDGYVCVPAQAPVSLEEAERRIAVARARLLEAQADRIGTNLRILDLPDTVARITQLEAERDEAVARADVADYTREALVRRCQELEAKLAVEGGVVGADAEENDGAVTVSISEEIVGFNYGRPVRVTTMGKDVVDLLKRHNMITSFYNSQKIESEAA